VVQQSAPYSKTYRVDLSRNEWCEDECRGVHPIFEVQPAYLILSGDASRLVITVDRVTGAHRGGQKRKGSAVKLIQTGKCERTVFSGFPSFNTKF
jgi:hypothetical protein